MINTIGTANGEELEVNETAIVPLYSVCRAGY
jgi:hypothetical protein